MCDFRLLKLLWFRDQKAVGIHGQRLAQLNRNVKNFSSISAPLKEMARSQLSVWQTVKKTTDMQLEDWQWEEYKLICKNGFCYSRCTSDVATEAVKFGNTMNPPQRPPWTDVAVEPSYEALFRILQSSRMSAAEIDCEFRNNPIQYNLYPIKEDTVQTRRGPPQRIGNEIYLVDSTIDKVRYWSNRLDQLDCEWRRVSHNINDYLSIAVDAKHKQIFSCSTICVPLQMAIIGDFTDIHSINRFRAIVNSFYAVE